MGWCTWEVLGKEEQAQGRWGKEGVTDIHRHQGETTELAQKKALQTHWWRVKSRDGGPSMDSMWMEISRGRYGPMSCVFEVGLTLRSPENKRDADL